jgi:hypothetical protein
MRTLNSVVAIALLGTALTAPAHAGSYTAAENVCESAISERLGAQAVPSQYTLEKVHNTMHYRDLSFVVAAQGGATAAQDIKVNCRVRKTGSLMALTFDPAVAAVSVATQ